MQRVESTVQLESLQSKFVTHIQKEPEKIKSFNRLPDMKVEYFYEKYRVLEDNMKNELEKKLRSK